MNLHEYQAKELLKTYGVPVPPGKVASSAKEASDAAAALGGSHWVVKAQVHAGGRGRAGGVKLVKSSKGAGEAAGNLLGTRLITAQTGAEGKEVKRVYVEQAVDVAKEIYLAALVDRALGRVAFLASAEGGEDIEEAAAEAPDKINKLVIDPETGLKDTDAKKLAADLGLSGGQANAAAEAMASVYKAFIENDASLIEINPLAVFVPSRPVASAGPRAARCVESGPRFYLGRQANTWAPGLALPLVQTGLLSLIYPAGSVEFTS